MTPRRILALAILASMLLVGAALGWGYYNAGAVYEDVVSIRGEVSYQDDALLDRAWTLPVAAAYREGGYEQQDNPSFCGPASAANLLQSQGVPVTQAETIDATNIKPIFGILPGGLTLDQEAELLRVNTGQRVDLLRDLDLAAFRNELAHANDLTRRYIVNFHRGPLFGEGHGHFSPILGYLPDSDLVFVGDVNRDYGPFLVSAERLFAAMQTIDSATGQKRGLLRVDASTPPRRR